MLVYAFSVFFWRFFFVRIHCTRLIKNVKIATKIATKIGAEEVMNWRWWDAIGTCAVVIVADWLMMHPTDAMPAAVLAPRAKLPLIFHSTRTRFSQRSRMEWITVQAEWASVCSFIYLPKYLDATDWTANVMPWSRTKEDGEKKKEKNKWKLYRDYFFISRKHTHTHTAPQHAFCRLTQRVVPLNFIARINFLCTYPTERMLSADLRFGLTTLKAHCRSI